MKKVSIIFFSILLFPPILFAQSVGIGTNTPNSSAKLDISSVNQGLLPPRMNFSQRNAIQNPVSGLIIYCTTCGIGGDLQVFSRGKWKSMTNQPTSDSIIKPSLTTTPVSSVNYNSAVSGGTILTSGQLPVNVKGVVWDINPNPDVFLSTKTVDSIDNSSFTATISGLSNNTTYYIRSYAITENDTSYGNELVFTTDAILIDENFETQFATSIAPYNPISIENWQNLSEIGTKKFDARVFNNNKYAFLSSYGTNNGTTKTWLVTKGINVNGLNSKILTFDTKQDFYMSTITGGGFPVPAELKILISSNYSGTGDPWAGGVVWDDITSLAMLSPGSTISNYPANYTSSGPVDISTYNGIVFIAFQYIGFDNPSPTPANGDKTSTWEIDNIKVTGN